MALIHHSAENYDLAAARAAANARQRLDEIIENGRGNAMKVIEQIHTRQVFDAVPLASEVDFAVDRTDEKAPALVLAAPGSNLPVSRLHRNALQQLADRADIPAAYVSHLLDPKRREWGPQLLAENFGANFAHQPADTRVLVRSVAGEVRGVLSDRYRRLDSRPLVEAFATSAAAVGAVPIEGYALDTRVALKAILPRIYEPVKNEVMVFGVSWGNSDFGNGAHSVRIFTMRLVCTNYAIAEESMRDVHLGRRLSGDVAFSARTLQLDTETTASAIGDVVRGQLSEARIDAFQAAIRRANEEQIDPAKALPRLRKQLTKKESDEVSGAFNGSDTVYLPAGQTAWRLSNAVSWVAGHTKDQERALELMQLAGDLVPIAKAS